MAGHEELSDYIRLSVYGTSDPCSGTSLYHMPHAADQHTNSSMRDGGGAGGGGVGGGGGTARSQSDTLSRGSWKAGWGGGGGPRGGGGAFGRRARAAGVFVASEGAGGMEEGGRGWGEGGAVPDDPKGGRASM